MGYTFQKLDAIEKCDQDRLAGLSSQANRVSSLGFEKVSPGVSGRCVQTPTPTLQSSLGRV
jgi:hypothetical protein